VIRAYFSPSYYAANIADLDGNHLEIAHKNSTSQVVHR
jgi:predicted lactoylglutathione lyase